MVQEKCSGSARQRLGPKFMNCCKPGKVGTKEHGKMWKRIQVFEDGRAPAKEATNWKIGEQKRKITRKEYQRLLNKFETEGFMTQKRIVESRKKQSFARQVPCLGKNATPLESMRQCMKRIS